MSYEPTTWKAGDTVTSAKLNKMEQGIVSNSNEPLIVTMQINDEIHTFNKTWKEVNDAFMAGRPVIVNVEDDYYGRISHGYVVSTSSEINQYSSNYECRYFWNGSIEQHTCTEEEGYPECSYV